MLFVTGFAIPFTMMGIAFSQLAFLQDNVIARTVMGLLVIAFGAVLAGGRATTGWRVTTMKRPEFIGGRWG